ncbi:radical S-adenosyl methionine domain-containing protein 2 [Usnea florida]
MSLVLLLLALLTIALSAYFMPTTSPSRKVIQEGADALTSAPEETKRKDTKTRIPISVNYHLTRQCNYSCGFCFHTATSSHVESLPNAQRAMLLLKEAGMRKTNFAGGEPFLQPRFLGRLARYCKDTLHLESVSIVTNGSKVTGSWLAEYGAYIDIMAVSCDSFDEATNVKIGRGKGAHLKKFRELREMCEGYGVMFKVNTVVNRYNWQEDMNAAIQAINPKRWKCFQVLIIDEENGGGANTLRDARHFRISDEEFRTFCERHEGNGCFVPEGNDVMKSSYLLLDEYLCFLNKGVKGKTRSVLEVGVREALGDVYWDEEGFRERGGVYDWIMSSGREGE